MWTRGAAICSVDAPFVQRCKAGFHVPAHADETGVFFNHVMNGLIAAVGKACLAATEAACKGTDVVGPIGDFRDLIDAEDRAAAVVIFPCLCNGTGNCALNGTCCAVWKPRLTAKGKIGAVLVGNHGVARLAQAVMTDRIKRAERAIRTAITPKAN